MYSYESNVEMTRRYRREHTLMGFEAEDLLNSNEIAEKGRNLLDKWLKDENTFLINQR